VPPVTIAQSPKSRTLISSISPFGDLALSRKGFLQNLGFAENAARRIDPAPIIRQCFRVKRRVLRNPRSHELVLDLGEFVNRIVSHNGEFVFSAFKAFKCSVLNTNALGKLARRFVLRHIRSGITMYL
jgi:hypothetical protein